MPAGLQPPFIMRLSGMENTIISDSGSGSDVVMTDQLCGQFYARLLSFTRCGGKSIHAIRL
ncbi:MAG UNVERIFIED_CONTAM: hypothetical protein LVR29_17440 [Microcystis novacekii LVE1205-3]